MKLLVVGAGWSGAVVAREIADALDCEIVVLDERAHIGGNSHTERDHATGVMIHRYGPHIFNTNDRRVWDYVNSYGRFFPFVNRVKADTLRGIFSLPINLHTINQFFGLRLRPSEAREFLAGKGDATIAEPANFEEQALKFLGADLYQTFFLGYTRKQWGCDPKELPASILKRLPVRFNYDDNYYDKAFQGIPEDGYTAVIERILKHPRIKLLLNCKFEHGESEKYIRDGYSHIFYTGPLDAYFGHSLGRLSYRTVTFERIDAEGDFQGNAVINYPREDVAWTRIHEHKHFAPWEKHEKTVAFREYSKETCEMDIPYYPKRLAADLQLLEGYRSMAGQAGGVSFLGRLATYRYMDMEAVISEALQYAERFIRSVKTNEACPAFPNQELPVQFTVTR